MGGDFTGIGVSRLGQTWPNLLGHRMGAVEPPVVSFLEAEAGRRQGDDKRRQEPTASKAAVVTT